MTPDDSGDAAGPAGFWASGVGQVCLSALFFSLMGLCIKELRTGLGAMEVVFFRSLASLLLTLAVIGRDVRAVIGNRRGLLFLRGISGCAALWCYVVALGVIPYAEAAALLYTGPVFTALFAAWFLRERMTRRGWIALTTALAGSVLILRPGFLSGASDFVWSGGAAALGAGVLSGVAYTSVRACARTERDVTIVLWFALVATVVSAVSMVADFRWPDPTQWAWIAALGVTAQLGQVFLTRGLRAQQAGTAMTGAFAVIALAALWGALFFGEVPQLPTVVGGVCIVGSIVLVSRATRAASRRPVSP